ncbi:MAG: RhuM family protein [Thermodesulfobacteriota bacterium]
MAELYQVSVKTVNEHLINIYAEGELEEEATIRKFRIVQIEGARQVSRFVDHYNLDVVLAVGYRVRSARGDRPRMSALISYPTPGESSWPCWLLYKAS